MAIQNLLIMNLLRIITPEEIADIATKHNGGKFLSLTDLVNERVEKKIYRDFSSTDAVDEIHQEHAKQLQDKNGGAKILPFGKKEILNEPIEEVPTNENSSPRLFVQAKPTSQLAQDAQEYHASEVVDQVAPAVAPVVEHRPDENMSTFILIEKERLKSSQKILKQKEIIDLYQKNSNVDVELIKSTNQTAASSTEGGVLVSKKHY